MTRGDGINHSLFVGNPWLLEHYVCVLRQSLVWQEYTQDGLISLSIPVKLVVLYYSKTANSPVVQ